MKIRISDFMRIERCLSQGAGLGPALNQYPLIRKFPDASRLPNLMSDFLSTLAKATN